MKIKVKQDESYIPDWEGNKEDPKPITVHYRFLTAGQREDFVHVEPVKMRMDGDTAVPEISVKQDASGMAKAMITRIENFEVETAGKTKVIDDAASLYGTPGVPAALIKDIERELQSASAVIDAAPLG